MLLARATCSALRIAQRPAANALAIPSRLLGAASSLKSSSLYQTTSSRLLSTSTSLRNSSEASSPPPPAPTSSEEGIQADRSSVDPLSEPFATDQEPSQTPLASTTPSSSPSLDDPAASSTDRAPIDIFKPRGDESQPSPSNRVFVKGSAFDKHEEWLVNEVAKALDLERTQLTVWRPSSDGVEGRRRGYGWIDLPTAEDAEKLVSLAPTFGGRPLAWAFATSPRTSDTLIVSAPSPPSSQIPSTQNALTPRLRSIIKRVAERSPDSRSSATALSSSLNGVFFRDLSVDITEAQLKLAVVTALAIEDGDVLSCRVPMNSKGGGNRGFGFVDLSSPALAECLISTPRAALNLSSNFYTKLYQPPTLRKESSIITKPTNSLYVRNLPPRIAPAALYAALEPFGTVWRVNWVTSKHPTTGAERLSAFMGMETVAAAQAAVEQANSAEGLLVRGSRVEVSFASVLRGKGLRTEKDDEEMARRRRELLAARRTGTNRKEKEVIKEGRRALVRVAKRAETRPKRIPKRDEGSGGLEWSSLANLFRNW